MKFFHYCWNLCYATSKKIVITLFHLIFITLFCTLPHELGHALAANCFSNKVKYIMLGFGGSSRFSFSLIYKFKLGKMPLIFGYTRYERYIGDWKKDLVITSAGLIMNLLLALLAWWAESKIENKFWKKFFCLLKEYNLLTIIYNFLDVLWNPNCDVRKIFSLLFLRG